MARILLTTHGSSGDVFPCIAVGAELRARGHDVRFAVTSQWAPVLNKNGFPVIQLPDEHEAFPGVAATALHILLPMVRYKQSLHQAVASLRRRTDALSDACRDADVLVTTSSQPTAPTAAERTRTRWITYALTPLVIPSASFSPTPLPLRPPRWFRPYANRFSWAVGKVVLRLIADRPLNLLRHMYGLAPRQDVLMTGNLSHDLTAVPVSPTFFPRPSDWPPYVQITGFCFWDTGETWQMPASLNEFFDTTVPIIAVSSGSMAPALSNLFTDFYRTSIAAIHRIGARALVIGASPNVLPDPLPQNVYALTFAPFSQIYPRCTAVIHHGGVGSIAQTLRAGKPMLVVPWGFDQFLLGQQVTDTGVGQWMDRRRYKTERVATSLAALSYDQRYTSAVQAMAKQLAQEDGVTTFCDKVEDMLGEIRSRYA